LSREKRSKKQEKRSKKKQAAIGRQKKIQMEADR